MLPVTYLAMDKQEGMIKLFDAVKCLHMDILLQQIAESISYLLIDSNRIAISYSIRSILSETRSPTCRRQVFFYLSVAQIPLDLSCRRPGPRLFYLSKTCLRLVGDQVADKSETWSQTSRGTFLFVGDQVRDFLIDAPAWLNFVTCSNFWSTGGRWRWRSYCM